MGKYIWILILFLGGVWYGCERHSGEIAGEEKKMNIRKSVLAGSWYSSNPETLRKEITGYLNNVKLSEEIKSHDVHSLIVPHAGHEYSGQGAAYGYALLKNKPFKRVIIIGPNHQPVGFRGLSVSKATHYETPLGRVPLDQEACAQLLKKDKLFCYHKNADDNEHSLEIQLPFLQSVLSDYQIVPLIAGEIDNYEDTAKAIREIIDGGTLVVISSDFTHYGDSFVYVPFRDNIKDNLKKLDDGAIAEIVNISPKGFLKYVQSTGITVCGYKPIAILLHLLDKTEILNSQGVLLNYYTSGDLTGDYSHCVSYAAILFSRATSLRPQDRQEGKQDDLNEAEQKVLLSLARETLRQYLKEKKTPKVKDSDLTERLREKRGVFVTLEREGELRGCIGCIFNPPPLYEGVIEYAINSAVNDWRFPPVSAEEEKKVTIEISVLSPMRKVDKAEDIVVGKHGVYLIKGGNNAIFLPQVAPEQGWTREEMLENLALKAGLPKDGWRKGAEFMVFTAQVFHEK